MTLTLYIFFLLCQTVSNVLTVGEVICVIIYPIDPSLHPTNFPLHIINLPHFPAFPFPAHLQLFLLILFFSLPLSHHHSSFLPLTTTTFPLPLHIHPLLYLRCPLICHHHLHRHQLPKTCLTQVIQHILYQSEEEDYNLPPPSDED